MLCRCSSDSQFPTNDFSSPRYNVMNFMHCMNTSGIFLLRCQTWLTTSGSNFEYLLQYNFSVKDFCPSNVLLFLFCFSTPWYHSSQQRQFRPCIAIWFRVVSVLPAPLVSFLVWQRNTLYVWSFSLFERSFYLFFFNDFF